MKTESKLRAFRSSFLGLPVIVTRTNSLVSIGTRWNTQTLVATFLAEEHAWLVVLCLATPPRTLW